MKRCCFLLFLVGGFCIASRAQSIPGPGRSIPKFNPGFILKRQAQPFLLENGQGTFTGLNRVKAFSQVAIPYRENLPEGAVFCRMESMMLNRFNLRFRMRAGDVDAYYLMIEQHMGRENHPD